MSTEILCSRRSILGESPRWDDRAKLVHWLDIDAGLVLSIALAGGAATELAMGAPCGALVLHEDGDLVLARGDTWVRLGSHREESIHKPAMRFNDAGVDSLGTIWSATMRVDEVLEGTALGVLYRVGARIDPVVPGLIAGNGIAWSPDERVMYFVDSGTNTVMRAAFEAASAEVGVPTPWLTVSEGLADGIAVDAAGGLWVAQWGTGSVRRYDQHAQATHRISIPAAQVTAVSFAGDSLDQLVITTAAVGTRSDEDPHAGALFVADAPIPGVALHRTRW